MTISREKKNKNKSGDMVDTWLRIQFGLDPCSGFQET